MKGVGHLHRNVLDQSRFQVFLMHLLAVMSDSLGSVVVPTTRQRLQDLIKKAARSRRRRKRRKPRKRVHSRRQLRLYRLLSPPKYQKTVPIPRLVAVQMVKPQLKANTLRAATSLSPTVMSPITDAVQTAQLQPKVQTTKVARPPAPKAPMVAARMESHRHTVTTGRAAVSNHPSGAVQTTSPPPKDRTCRAVIVTTCPSAAVGTTSQLPPVTTMTVAVVRTRRMDAVRISIQQLVVPSTRVASATRISSGVVQTVLRSHVGPTSRVAIAGQVSTGVVRMNTHPQVVPSRRVALALLPSTDVVLTVLQRRKGTTLLVARIFRRTCKNTVIWTRTGGPAETTLSGGTLIWPTVGVRGSGMEVAKATRTASRRKKIVRAPVSNLFKKVRSVVPYDSPVDFCEFRQM